VTAELCTAAIKSLSDSERQMQRHNHRNAVWQ